MNDRPIPIDLSRHVELIAGAREFLRLWATADGPVFCFINPVPVGADPMGFGLALVDAIGHAAKAYARAVDISEDEARARIWEGVDAERARPTDSPIEFTPRKDH